MDATTRTRTALLEAILAYVEEVAGSRPGDGPTGGSPAAWHPLDLGGIAALLEAAARLLEDDVVGLHFAERFDLDALGPFSYAVLHAPTVGTAVRNLQRYSGALALGAALTVEIDGRTASVRLPAWAEDDPRRLRHIDEAAVLFVLRMLRRLGGRGWSPRAIDFRHPAPSDLTVHRRLLGAPLRFGRPATAILVSSADLDRPVRDADRQRLPVVERHLDDILSDPGDVDPWRHALELQIASLVCDGHPSLRIVAPRLGMSVRSVQRRLDERGTSYRALVAQVRMRMAHHYLGERALGLGEIGFLLGYAEPSAFDRAFRRWTGTTPGEYRRRAGERADWPALPGRTGFG